MTDDVLRRHLRSCGCAPGDIAAALAALEPFRAIAASGRWPLDRASTAPVGDIASALWHAGRFHVRGCIFEASCLKKELPEASLADAVALAPPPGCDGAFEIVFDKEIGLALKSALAKTAGDGACAGRRSAFLVAHRTLLAYVAFLATGRHDDAARLAPLIALLPSYVPLAERRDSRDEGVWYVLSGC